MIHIFKKLKYKITINKFNYEYASKIIEQQINLLEDIQRNF